jgi:hypothetical protein
MVICLKIILVERIKKRKYYGVLLYRTNKRKIITNVNLAIIKIRKND